MLVGCWPADAYEGRSPPSNCCNQSKVISVSCDVFVCHKEQELKEDFPSLIKNLKMLAIKVWPMN